MNRALTDDRSLLIAWLNRGTLQLVRSEDYPWLQALTTPPLLTSSATRLGQEGVSPAEADRAVARIEKWLADEGPLTRPQLRERLDAAGIRTEGQAFIHLLYLASLRGVAVRGPMVGKQHAYVLVRDWLGPQPVVDRDIALAELARRFLAGHWPSTERDLARWSGLPLRDARAGLAAIASELEDRDDGLLAPAARPPATELPPPTLLGAFDPVLLGWVPRDAILGRHGGRVIRGGLFRPIAIVEGRAVAGWAVGKGGVAIEPYGRISKRDRAALDADANDVERFLGEV